MPRQKYLGPNEVAFHLPAVTRAFAHRKPVQRVRHTQDGGFVVCSQEGLVSFWTARGHLRSTKSFVGPDKKRAKQTWVNDMVLMPEYNKIAVSAAGGREIKMYEMSTFEASCQIHPLNSVPLRMEYCSTGPENCLILYGDNEGCINLLVISSAPECFRLWKKAPPVEGVPSVDLETIALGPNTKYVQWKAHGDWVKQLRYSHDINQIISCSNHTNTALVIRSIYGSTFIDPPRKKSFQNYIAAKSKQIMQNQSRRLVTKKKIDQEQTVFRVYRGVTCFAICGDKNIITGGLDRILRIWNPYLSETPTGVLRGHSAPVVYLFVESKENRGCSVSADRCIKVWDIQEQSCLLSIDQKDHKISGQLLCCHFNSVTKTLILSTDHLQLLPLKLRPVRNTDIPITHNQPIQAAIYNPVFKHVITCSDASNIKVWDMETGGEVLEFARAHGTSAITCLTLDRTGRRLITGGRDGCVRLWNYRNGHCLRTLRRKSGSKEVCAVMHGEIDKSRFIVSVGWDRHINVYSDRPEDGIRLLQHPLPVWAHDKHDGHKDDILSVSQCPPNLLATSSYDGEVIVWNLISGHIFCYLRAPKPEGYHQQAFSGEESIYKVLFLRSRAGNKRAASLVASGPWCHVHMWNVSRGGAIMARFRASRRHGAVISAMTTNKSNSSLYTADTYGWVWVWGIEKYCTEHPETGAPKLECSWRAHTECVTAMTYLNEPRLLLTASLDCRVRLWTAHGVSIGTFGQPSPWRLSDQVSDVSPEVASGEGEEQPSPLGEWHPIRPGDEHPSHPDSLEKDKDLCQYPSPRQTKSVDQESLQLHIPDQLTVFNGAGQLDDQKIATLIVEQQAKWKDGKRLRHEKYKPTELSIGPTEYRMLKCFDLDQLPIAKPESPKLLSVYRKQVHS